jgi:hypothetical protein
MKWLERVRQKNFAPYNDGGAISAKSQEGDLKNLQPQGLGNDTRAKSYHEGSSVTFGTPEGVGREVFMVTYQRSWLDCDLRDGTYTPTELQQARLLVKHGPVLRYRLHWPGGTPQPIDVADEQEARPRSELDAFGAPVVEVKRRASGGFTGPGIKRL